MEEWETNQEAAGLTAMMVTGINCHTNRGRYYSLTEEIIFSELLFWGRSCTIIGLHSHNISV